MAFDVKEFVLAVVAVIIGAYILNFLGVLNHGSPANAYTGIGGYRPSVVPYVKNIGSLQMGSTCAGRSCTGHTSIASGTVGATGLNASTSIRPL